MARRSVCPNPVDGKSGQTEIEKCGPAESKKVNLCSGRVIFPTRETSRREGALPVTLLLPLSFQLRPKLPKGLGAAVLSGIFDGLSGALHVGAVFQLPEGL